MAEFQRHLFICVNERTKGDARGCCLDRDGAAVAKAFKKGLYRRGLKRVMRANKSGCLDQCAHGVVCVVYPEGTWYGRVTVDDVDEIIDQHLLGGQPVERLVLRPEQLTGIAKPVD